MTRLNLMALIENISLSCVQPHGLLIQKVCHYLKPGAHNE